MIPNTMMKGTSYTIQSKACGLPEILRSIPDPPQQLYVAATQWPDLLKLPAVAIVGSRKVTSYGRAVTQQLAGELARAGVCIVSGLAIGVDAIAHRAALQAGGYTVAVLASGLDTIYPNGHTHLAKEIVQQGGALVSEYSPGTSPYKYNFVARNRLVSGLSRLTIITEAAEKSGTLHTAAFALEQGRDVFAVPGAITSPTSKGTNQLIKHGAALVSNVQDILQALGMTLAKKASVTGDTPAEQQVLDLLLAGQTDGGVLLRQSQLSAATFNQTITMLEITGKITAQGNNQWTAN